MIHRLAGALKVSVAVVGGLALAACTEPGVAPAADDPSLVIFQGEAGNRTPEHNRLEICKDGSSAKIMVDLENSGSDPATLDFTDGQCSEIGDDKFLGFPTDFTVAEWEAETGFVFDHMVVTEILRVKGVDVIQDPFTVRDPSITLNASGANGFLIEFFNVPEQEPCLECKGGVIELTLQYNGAAPAQVRIESETVVFNRMVQPGETFTIFGDRDDGKLKKDIKIFVDGVEQTKIHTSCSKPIGPGATFGDFVVTRAVSKDNGVVCPVPDCLECKGGVIELTLRYNGTEAAQVRIESETVVFDQMVQPGEEFTIFGDRDDGKFKNDIKVFVNDQEEQQIHTSCSRPIGPGALFGLFEVVEAISKDNGKVCPLPECQECKGGVVQLTLRYNGAEAAQVRIESETVVFDQMVQPGEEFTIFGDRSDGKFKNDIKVFIDDVEQTKIHTSCSKPIGPGTMFGDFEVVEAISKDNGKVCPAGQSGDSCDDGKPQMLIMEYTGQDCSVTSHTQDDGKVSCTGDPAFEPTVAVLAGDKENPDDSDAGRFFDGLVALNGLFAIDATNDNENRLKSNTWAHIFDASGTNLLQSVQFHTSCSQPLAVGNIFGSLTLIDFIPEP